LFLRLDTSGAILDYRSPQPSALLGSAQDLPGKKIQELIPPEAGSLLEKAIGRVRKTSAMVAIEFSLPKTGGEMFFEARLIPLHWKEIIVIIRDITERTRAERRVHQYAEEVQEKNAELASALATAREATLLKGRFLANMSHEIRTPMNGVLGMTDLLLETPLNSEQREYAEAVKQSAGALLTITNDILDLSKIEAGRLTIECIPFDMAAVANDVIAWFRARARAKGLELTTQLPADLPKLVRGDPVRLRQILTNLLGNAIKFTDTGRVGLRIEVTDLTDESLSAKFSVEDTGIGIPPEHRAQLFESFTQGDSSTTRKYGGTGLGLAISKQLVELLGGTIGVDSERGRGSTFWFTAVFERRSVDETLMGGEQAAPASPAKLDDMRVLVVGDAGVNTDELRAQLSSLGCVTEQLASATWIVAELRLKAETGRPFHAVLLDIDAPDIDTSVGIEIAADPVLYNTALIALTSAPGQADDALLRERGFASCLAKPAPQAQLHLALSRVWRTDPSPIFSPARARAAENPQAGNGLETEPPRPRVLVAEDNSVNQLIVVRLLEKAGLKADVVSNGSQAVAAIGNTVYDLILMDCQMPEMDGFEATAEIRRLEGNQRHTTICALTAHAMAGDRERCLAAGMDDYISKPLTAGVLHNKIAYWIYERPKSANGSAHMQPVGIKAVSVSRLPALQRFVSGFFHCAERRRLARPDFELAHGLLDEHLDAGYYDLLLLAGPLDESGLERVIDHVEYDVRRNVAIEKAAVHMRVHPYRRGVHDRVEFMSGDLVPGQRLRAAGFRQCSNPIRIAAGEGDFGSGVDQSAGRAAGCPAVAGDQHAGARRPQMAR
jgi:PAS domain S-box-containing protein